MSDQDIKPDNLLISEPGLIKLGDFGMKTLLEHLCMNKSKQAEMLYYTAPEVYNNTIEKKSDVWSLGITLIELAEGNLPTANHPLHNL